MKLEKIPGGYALYKEKTIIGTCQARPAGVSHHVHICQALACFGHHGLGEREHPADMVAAGQLGHHAAIRLVHLDLAVQRMRQQGGHSHPTS